MKKKKKRLRTHDVTVHALDLIHAHPLAALPDLKVADEDDATLAHEGERFRPHTTRQLMTLPEQLLLLKATEHDTLSWGSSLTTQRRTGQRESVGTVDTMVGPKHGD